MEYPWVYLDYKSNLWKFIINNNSELVYSVMYNEGKWTENKKIESKATSCSLLVDKKGIIHLVYVNDISEIKYCTMKDNKWLGKTIYSQDNKNYKIENIKTIIIGSYMHIFYVAISIDGSDHCIIFHCIWDGFKAIVNYLEDIILRKGIQDYYLIKSNYKNDIFMFYLSDDGDEISLNYSAFIKNKWLKSKRLYGIRGEEIEIDIKIENDIIHIINKSKENYEYNLEHVTIDYHGNLKNYNIYSGNEDLKQPLIVNKEGKIFCTWISKGSIYYSIFLLDKWDYPNILVENSNKKIIRYNSFIDNIDSTSINSEAVYGTNELDLVIYNPISILSNVVENANVDKEEISKKDNINLNNELYGLKKENIRLMEEVEYLNSLVARNQEIIRNYKSQIKLISDQKRKAEENSNIIVELQKKLQEEYEDINETLLNKDNENEQLLKSLEDLNNKFKEVNKEIKNYEIQVDSLKKEVSTLNSNGKIKKDTIETLTKENENYSSIINDLKKMEEEKNEDILSLTNLVNNLKEENLVIKKEITSLLEENKALNSELEFQKNKSLLERILKKK